MGLHMMNKGNKLVCFISVLVFVLIIAPILFYILHFHPSSLSNNTSDWGSFGSYYGGIISPISSICSTLLLVYITLLIDKKNSQEAHDTEVLETKKKHFYQIVEKLQIFNDWLCARRRFVIEEQEAKRKYSNLSHEEKDKIKYSEYLAKMDLCHRFIYDEYINLLSLNYYIQELGFKYKYTFESMNDLDEYIQLKHIFEAFTKDIEMFITGDKKDLPINEKEIKQSLSTFITILQLELHSNLYNLPSTRATASKSE